MFVKINGKKEETQAETLDALLKSKDIEPQMVSVELNNALIARTDLADSPLKEGDAIELLFFMGGGI
ncbi:MAG: sulfur carrier protein ThiS [Nitrospirae bacterium]|nr:sulfur carrier protein ThiS [Candidatus Manganitrophaceae bacterium]